MPRRYTKPGLALTSSRRRSWLHWTSAHRSAAKSAGHPETRGARRAVNCSWCRPQAWMINMSECRTATATHFLRLLLSLRAIFRASCSRGGVQAHSEPLGHSHGAPEISTTLRTVEPQNLYKKSPERKAGQKATTQKSGTRVDGLGLIRVLVRQDIWAKRVGRHRYCTLVNWRTNFWHDR